MNVNIKNSVSMTSHSFQICLVQLPTCFTIFKHRFAWNGEKVIKIWKMPEELKTENLCSNETMEKFCTRSSKNIWHEKRRRLNRQKDDSWKKLEF